MFQDLAKTRCSRCSQPPAFPSASKASAKGGSGLYSQSDGSLALPNCEGVVQEAILKILGPECLTEAPCEDCDYFPVLPTPSDEGFQSCLFMYDNDNAAHSTAVPGHTLLTEAGHNATLRIFASNPPEGPADTRCPCWAGNGPTAAWV